MEFIFDQNDKLKYHIVNYACFSVESAKKNWIFQWKITRFTFDIEINKRISW